MKILQVTDTLSAKGGGPPMVITRLAAAQAALGHNVTLYCYQTPPGDAESPTDDRRAQGRLHQARLVRGGRLERVLPRGAMRDLSRVVSGYDVVHLHGVWYPICLAAARAAQAAGVPYVLAPHGMLDPWALSEKALKKKVFLALAYRAMVNRASLIHALSDYEAQSIGALGYRPPVATIPNGVFLDEIDPLPLPGAYFAAHPELRGEPFVVFLSRLHPVKGLDILVEAFAIVVRRVPGARLVVIGPDWGAEADLRARARTLGVADRVHLVGPAYGKEKFAAMVDAACFCLPSKHEAFSVAIVEALAAGCPVVISEQCHFPQVQSEGAGLCVVRTPEAVAEALTHLLAEPTARGMMGCAGRRLVEARYTWERVAELSIRHYEQVVRQ
ncbi:MAG: glycosyl transferase [Phycisphaerae bacterium]|nr:MAG: glycosyl transferase [Phycisphaerae bacterium]